MPEKTNHYCNQCDYKSTRKWDCDRHMRSQHMSIGESVERPPTSVFVGDDTLKEPLNEIKEQ